LKSAQNVYARWERSGTLGHALVSMVRHLRADASLQLRAGAYNRTTAPNGPIGQAGRAVS